MIQNGLKNIINLWNAIERCKTVKQYANRKKLCKYIYDKHLKSDGDECVHITENLKVEYLERMESKPLELGIFKKILASIEDSIKKDIFPIFKASDLYKLILENNGFMKNKDDNNNNNNNKDDGKNNYGKKELEPSDYQYVHKLLEELRDEAYYFGYVKSTTKKSKKIKQRILVIGRTRIILISDWGFVKQVTVNEILIDLLELKSQKEGQFTLVFPRFSIDIHTEQCNKIIACVIKMYYAITTNWRDDQLMHVNISPDRLTQLSSQLRKWANVRTEVKKLTKLALPRTYMKLKKEQKSDLKHEEDDEKDLVIDDSNRQYKRAPTSISISQKEDLDDKSNDEPKSKSKSRKNSKNSSPQDKPRRRKRSGKFEKIIKMTYDDVQVSKVAGRWDEISAGGCTNFNTWRNNPQFIFTIDDDSRVKFNLIQVVANKDEIDPIGLYVLKYDQDEPNRKLTISDEDMIEIPRFAVSQYVSVELDLKKGERVVLLPCNFYPNIVKDFSISCESIATHELEIVPPLVKSMLTTVEGSWSGSLAGGCYPNNPTWRNNPMYEITIAKKTKVLVILTQETTNDDPIAMGFYVVKKEPKWPRKLRMKKADVIHVTGMKKSLEVTAILELEPFEEGSLVIIPCLFSPGDECGYALSIYNLGEKTASPSMLQIPNELPPNIVSKQYEGSWEGISAGGCFPNKGWKNNQQFSLKFKDRKKRNGGLVRLLVVIHQSSLRKLPSIGVCIAKSHVDQYGQLQTKLTKRNVLVQTAFSKVLEITCECLLEQDPDVSYCIIPSTFETGRENTFSIQIFADCEFQFRKLEKKKANPEYNINVTDVWEKGHAGGSFPDHQSWRENPQFKISGLPEEPTFKVTLTLSQNIGSVGYLVANPTVDGRGKLCLSKENIIYMSELKSSKIVTRLKLDTHIDGKMATYIVIPLTALPNTMGEFSLSALSEYKDLRLSRIEPLTKHNEVEMAQIGDFLAFDLQSREDTFVSSWGQGKYNQLGYRKPLSMITYPKGISALKDRRVRYVAAGDTFCGAVTEKGLVFMWGVGKEGELGLGVAIKESKIPYLVASLRGISQLVCGSAHSIAISEKGVLYSWGSNSHGQLGHGSSSELSHKPQIIKSLEKKPCSYISAGGNSSACITEEEMYVWGDNQYGQLGTGSRHDSKTPKYNKLSEKGELVAVNLGKKFGAAIFSDGRLYTWGSNKYGQLGHGDYKSRKSPRQVNFFSENDLDVFKVSCGQYQMLTISDGPNEKGIVHCVGRGKYCSERKDQLTPILLDIGTDARYIATSSTHALVVDSSCRIYSFGLNNFGQLGTGDDYMGYRLAEVDMNPNIKIAQVACGKDFSLCLARGKQTSDLRNHEDTDISEQEEKDKRR